MKRNRPSWTMGQAEQALEGRAASCVPSQVPETVPSCALTCVEDFIATYYGSTSTCADTSSLDFLCTTSNASGFTLGEAALRCLVSNCSSTASEGQVYGICGGIMGSIPETVATITATVAPSLLPAATTQLPPSIAKPSTTPNLSTFAAATGSPSVVTTPQAPAPTPATTFSTSSTFTQASSEQATTAASTAKVQSAGLSTGAVAGIAVGSVALIAGLFSLLFFLICLRKRRNSRRPVSRRWSIAEFPPTPPGKDSDKAANPPAPTFTPNQRFYAAAVPQEKRRSFWRKSINPQDIGVAVSPGKVEDSSPTSLQSEKSMSRLLTNGKAPALRPAPLLNFPAPPQGVSRYSGHTVPVSNGQQPIASFNSTSAFGTHAPYETRLSQPPQQQTQSSLPHPLIAVPTFNVQAPYETRLANIPPQSSSARAGPPPANPPNNAYNAERARGAAITGRIPLTPIYDNGNFGSGPSGRSAPIAYRWDTPESFNQLTRPGPHGTAQQPMGLNISNASMDGARLRKDALHRSTASDSTVFDEDTTPEEEIDRQLRRKPPPNTGQPSNKNLDCIPQGDSSPIKNLAYPQVPRPAAISRQAQQVPRPLAAQNINPVPIVAGVSRSLTNRYETSRAGQSFLVSESTSTSSSAPSLLAQRRNGHQKDLRVKTNAAANAMNSRWQVSKQQPDAAPVAKTLQKRPSLKDTSPKARIVPKANSRGDLFLTVDG